MSRWNKKDFVLCALEPEMWLRQLHVDWPPYFYVWEEYTGGLAGLYDAIQTEIDVAPGTTWLYKAYCRLDPDYFGKCRDGDAHLLYVGISENPLGRFVQHSKWAPWTEYTNWVSLETFSTRKDAELEERRVIQHFASGANVACQNNLGVCADQKRIPWTCDVCGESNHPAEGWSANDLSLAIFFGDQQPSTDELLVRFAVYHHSCCADQQQSGVWPSPVLSVPLWQYRTLEELSTLRRRIETIPEHQRNKHRADVPGTLTLDELVNRCVSDVRQLRKTSGVLSLAAHSLRKKVENLDQIIARVDAV